MAIPVSYNLRSLLQRPTAALTTAVGIGLTVMIFIGALALAAGFQAAMRKSGDPDTAIVLRKGADSEITSAISREAASIIMADQSVALGPDGRPLASADMVVLVNKPRLGQPGSSNVTVRGLDPSGLALRKEIRIVEGRTATPGTDEVIVGQRIARRFADCGIGDRIRFGQRAFTVVGHFVAGGSAFESEIWGDNSTLMPALGREDVFQSVSFRLARPERFDEAKRQFERDPRLQVQVERESDWYASQSELLANLIRILGTFITVIMAVGAVFGAMNTMYAAVGTRAREVATLLVLGFSPLAVMTSFTLESVFLAIAGGALGCLMALPINGIVTSTTNFSSFSEVAFAFRITPNAMLAGLVFAALIGLVGGFLPALKAARQPIAATLRGL